MAGEEELIRELRRRHAGVLSFSGRVAPVNHVIDGPANALVLGVEPPALSAADHVLFVPEERDDALQLMLGITPIGPEGDRATDRWQAYHGRADRLAWVRARIEGARRGEMVLDPERIDLSNPLEGAQGRLCRLLNADAGTLARACQAARPGVVITEPVAVGVDPEGTDVRVRGGLVRLGLPWAATDEQEAERVIADLLGGAGGRA